PQRAPSPPRRFQDYVPIFSASCTMYANQLTLTCVAAGRRGLYHAESSPRTRKVGGACASPSQERMGGPGGSPFAWTAMMSASPLMSRRHVLAGLAVNCFQLPAIAQPQGNGDGVRVLRAYQNTSTLPNGAAKTVWGFDGTAPGPALQIKRGEELRIRLTNELP